MAEPQVSSAAATAAEQAEERLFLASQWRLMWRRLGRHRVALAGGVVLLLFYLTMCLGAEFCATYTRDTRFKAFSFAPPARIRVVDADGRLRLPFVYGLESGRDPVSFRKVYTEDVSVRYPLRLFARGEPYLLWGLFPSDRHLIGVDEPGLLLLFGSDELGRDLFSRTLYGGRISLSIGLVGVAVSFVLGCILGGLSGFYGGGIDNAIQRVIEFLLSIPTIPLWMALAAAVPVDWPPLRVYFGITIILSIIGWTALARVVRGKLISTREEDFVVAAQIAGSTERKIIVRHLLPSFLSYLIVDLTLSIPRMILGETALSFLGLGLRPPVVSWGVLLNQAQNVKAVALHPWMLIPAVFVIVSVLAFNLLGDGLRDAADPYASH